MKREINIDYIGVVRQVDEGYIYEEREIVANEELSEWLRTIAEDESKTILDMQACLAEHFGEGEKRVYNYVLPHLYKMPFIDRVSYPVFMTAERYENERAKVAENVEFEEDVVATLAEYDSEIKEEFLAKALRYIAAVDFATTAEQIKQDPTVILASHEEIGWSKWEYSLDDNIKIRLNTNLGMGAVSYMTVDVCYNGVVLPSYSPLVKHFEADAYELSKHTASYVAERESWESILRFICDILSNSGWLYDFSKMDINTFEEGLRAIATDPVAALNAMYYNPTREEHLSGVRNMLQTDIDKYESCPIESATLFKATKITEALRFGRGLREWASVYPYASVVADYIEQLNRELAPTLLEEIAVQHQKIERLNARLDPITEQWQEIEEQLDENPDCADSLVAKGRLDEKIDTILGEMVTRDGFMKALQQCYAKITKAGILIDNLKMI